MKPSVTTFTKPSSFTSCSVPNFVNLLYSHALTSTAPSHTHDSLSVLPHPHRSRPHPSTYLHLTSPHLPPTPIPKRTPLPTLKLPLLPPPSPSLRLQLPLQRLPLRIRPLLRSFRADFRPRVGGNLLLRSRPWLWSRWGRRWLVRRSPGGRADGCAFAADRAELFAFGFGLLGRGRGGRGCWRGLRLGRGFAAADRAEFGFGVWFAGFRFGRRGG